jgi:hypothetical protein
MPVPHATESPDRIDRRPPRRDRETAATRTPSRTRAPRPSGRRRLAVALALAAAVHLILLWTLRLPAPTPPPRAGEITVAFEPIAPARPEAEDVAPEPPAGPAEAARTGRPRRAPPATLRPEAPIARPRASEHAPRVRTIPPTTLLAPLAPLEATPGGVGRQSAPVDARRVEIQRAESLLTSRLAGLPGAGIPRDPAVGLAPGGGVTVPVPWGGFVPENRKDRVWREERCAGKDADQADKPGEAEARNAQCD